MEPREGTSKTGFIERTIYYVLVQSLVPHIVPQIVNLRIASGQSWRRKRTRTRFVPVDPNVNLSYSLHWHGFLPFFLYRASAPNPAAGGCDDEVQFPRPRVAVVALAFGVTPGLPSVAASQMN